MSFSLPADPLHDLFARADLIDALLPETGWVVDTPPIGIGAFGPEQDEGKVDVNKEGEEEEEEEEEEKAKAKDGNRREIRVRARRAAQEESLNRGCLELHRSRRARARRPRDRNGRCTWSALMDDVLLSESDRHGSGNTEDIAQSLTERWGVVISSKQCRDRLRLITTDVVPRHKLKEVRHDVHALRDSMGPRWAAIADVVGKRHGLRLCGNRMKNLWKRPRCAGK